MHYVSKYYPTWGYLRTPGRVLVSFLPILERSIAIHTKNSVLVIQSILVISNPKGLSEILRDIRSSTYQMCRIEDKIIRTTTFNKYIYVIGLFRYIKNIVGKRRNCSLGAISPLFHNIFLLLLDFHV